MEGKENSDEKQIENVFTEESSEKQQALSSLPSYVKSCSSTQIESTTIDYSWKIDRFWFVQRTIDTLYSPPFSENGENKIQMNIIRNNPTSLSSIQEDISLQFYIRTSTAFTGSCFTVIEPNESPMNFRRITKSISGRMTDMTLLIETSKYQQYVSNDTFMLRVKFEIFQGIISNAIYMNLSPPSTLYLKDVKSENSTVDQFECKNEDTIKFIINGEKYVVPKKLLYATNSSYFKNMCLTHNEDEKNLTNELTTNEVEAFKHLLSFILTGSTKKIQNDYVLLKQLLTTANKYDVSALKLMCEHYLLRYITIGNAVELIQLAISSNAKFLESHSATFLKFYKNEIVNTLNLSDCKLNNLPQEDSYRIMELIEKSEILEISCLHKFVDFVITE